MTLEQLIHACVAAAFEPKDICRNFRRYTGRRPSRCGCLACQALYKAIKWKP